MGRSLWITSRFSMALNTEEWDWVLVLFVWVFYETWSMLRRRVTRATKMEKVSFLVACMSLKKRVYYWSRGRRNLETKLIFLPSWMQQRELVKANRLFCLFYISQMSSVTSEFHLL